MNKHEILDYSSGETFVMSYLLSNDAVKSETIGTGWLKRSIRAFSIGEGKRRLVFSHRGGTDGESARALLLWTSALGEAARDGGSVCGCNLKSLFKRATISIIPCLNPDGCELALHGVELGNPFAERLAKINPSADYRAWESNARGIDIRKNFNSSWFESKLEERRERRLFPAASGFGGEYPESEFESIALTGFIKRETPDLLVTVEKGEGRLSGFYPRSETDASLCRRAAEIVSAMSKLSCHDASGEELGGSPEGWFSTLFERPALRLSLNVNSDCAEICTLLSVFAGMAP